jgi:conserved hypothetical protein TIGR00104
MLIDTQFSLNAIGVIRSSLKTIQDSPPDGNHKLQEATLEIFPSYCLALSGMHELNQIVVCYWLHQADREVLRVYPHGDRNKEMIGVFCNRSPLRPNPIAISHVEILEVGVNNVLVRGLDAIDGTPIIDIKSLSSCNDKI